MTESHHSTHNSDTSCGHCGGHRHADSGHRHADSGHHHADNGHHHADNGHSRLLKIAVGATLLVAAIVVERTCRLSTWQGLLLFLVPYLVVGFDTLKEAAEGLVNGDAFNEHFLMSIATIGALTIGFLPGAETQFPEAVFVMLFFQLGEFFEGYAEGRSRQSIAHLMDIRPDSATVERDGVAVVVPPEEVATGETIIIRPGERVPLDAVIEEGSTTLNTAALTGESLPRDAGVGDEITSGCVNVSGMVKARVVKPFGESTVSRIISLVENAAEHKSRNETFIARFAKIYTPVVVFAAVAIALLPPLFAPSFATAFPQWLYRALLFLVVSCPCALVISVPLSFFGGIGGASRRGILVKGANYIDTLAAVDTVVFDKTGTLTQGRFSVAAVHADGCDERQLSHLAAHVERFSTHPIGAALRDAFPDEDSDGCAVSDVEEVAGHGVRARVDDATVCVGNERMMQSAGAACSPCQRCDNSGTVAHVAVNGRYAGHIVITDSVKEESAEAVKMLKNIGVQRTVMLTGDREATASKVAAQLGIDEYHSMLLPADKVKHVERLADSGRHGRLAFVGDGINDAPVLARADVGIAMGGLGSDAAIEAADVVIMDDDPTKIALAILIARRTLRIARQNVVFAIGVKVAILVLAATGLATMWMAVFGDVGVTVLAVLNAMRTLKVAD